ncbi:S-adenosyl-L-methionine-dependent methyltransferase [Senna tora]|uniref:S-adenosyl-L-methionine-dependent methyltransferase n=1 Tax=Senna tora TaxID=362788 RepID=A0A834SY96_9FABA|nr:S-adenosyl-L-methionine-dependent methyltransferase [Senna tora]
MGLAIKIGYPKNTASKAYLDTVKSCAIFRESGVAEFVSAMAAGWKAQLIVETWSRGGAITTSIGLAVARAHAGGRHVCIVPDEESRSEYERMVSSTSAAAATEIVVGEAEEAMEDLAGVDFLVVDCRRKDFWRVLRVAKLSGKGGVLVCKNADSRTASRFRWRSVVEDQEEEGSSPSPSPSSSSSLSSSLSSRRVVRSVFLPVGKGLEIAHVSAAGGNSVAAAGKGRSGKRWIKHFDQRSGELHVIRR